VHLPLHGDHISIYLDVSNRQWCALFNVTINSSDICDDVLLIYSSHAPLELNASFPRSEPTSRSLPADEEKDMKNHRTVGTVQPYENEEMVHTSTNVYVHAW
jgi:hypothetical protein